MNQKMHYMTTDINAVANDLVER